MSERLTRCERLSVPQKNNAAWNLYCFPLSPLEGTSMSSIWYPLQAAWRQLRYYALCCYPTSLHQWDVDRQKEERGNNIKPWNSANAAKRERDRKYFKTKKTLDRLERRQERLEKFAVHWKEINGPCGSKIYVRLKIEKRKRNQLKNASEIEIKEAKKQLRHAKINHYKADRSQTQQHLTPQRDPRGISVNSLDLT